jgi:hypothetical protein
MQNIDVNKILWEIAQIEDEDKRIVEWQKASVEIATYLTDNNKDSLLLKINDLYTQIELELDKLDKSIITNTTVG